jgi:hypothetical protein
LGFTGRNNGDIQAKHQWIAGVLSNSLVIKFYRYKKQSAETMPTEKKLLIQAAKKVHGECLACRRLI